MRVLVVEPYLYDTAPGQRFRIELARQHVEVLKRLEARGLPRWYALSARPLSGRVSRAVLLPARGPRRVFGRATLLLGGVG